MNQANQTQPAAKKEGFHFTFERTEVKYFIPKEVSAEFRRRMDPYIAIDEYGLTTICNIYYDSDDNDLVSRSMAKPPYKEKLRLRTYGIPTETSTAFMEIKKKYDGVVYKRRSAMPYAAAEMFLDRKEHLQGESQIERELAYVRDFYHLKPAMFLAYDREAFAGRRDPSMRMTIDRNIRYRTKDLSILNGDAGKLLNMDGGELLEVKVNGALPMEIVHIFNELHIYPKSFSKYGSAYTELGEKQARAIQAERALRRHADFGHTAVPGLAGVSGL